MNLIFCKAFKECILIMNADKWKKECKQREIEGGSGIWFRCVVLCCNRHSCVAKQDNSNETNSTKNFNYFEMYWMMMHLAELFTFIAILMKCNFRRCFRQFDKCLGSDHSTHSNKYGFSRHSPFSVRSNITWLSDFGLRFSSNIYDEDAQHSLNSHGFCK